MITVERTLITPEVAEQMLATSKGNRGIRRVQVDSLKAAMLSGEWEENGDTIRFYSDGALQDGHHRLTACVETGFSFHTLVVRGVEKSAAKTVDKGAKRSNADELSLHSGFTPDDARIAAGIARHIIVHDLGSESWPTPSGWFAKHLTATRVSQWVDENLQDVHDAIAFSRHVVRRGNKMLPKATVGALLILGCRQDETATRTFLEQVFLGHQVTEGTTADHVRNALLGAAMGTRKMLPRQRTLTVAKCLRSFISGRNIRHSSNAMFRPSVDSAAMFPAH